MGGSDSRSGQDGGQWRLEEGIVRFAGRQWGQRPVERPFLQHPFFNGDGLGRAIQFPDVATRRYAIHIIKVFAFNAWLLELVHVRVYNKLRNIQWLSPFSKAT